MRRIFTSASVAWPVTAGVAVFLIASHTGAAGQIVDPGWQLVYAGQPGYDDMDSMFGDGTGQPIVARAYQPAPLYSELPVPSPAYQPGPGYATEQAAAPPAHQAAPDYRQPRAAQQSRAYPPAPTYYYQQAPAPQVRATAPLPASNQQMPAQFAARPAPVSSWRSATTQQPNPQYTGSVPAQEVGGFLNAPTGYQVAPPASAHQPAMQYQRPVPPQRVAFGYESQQQQYGYQQQPGYQPQQQSYQPQQQQGFGFQGPRQIFGFPPQQQYGGYQPAYAPAGPSGMAQQSIDPRYERQVVEYHGNEQPGTIVIDTPHFFLYLVLDSGRALRYGIGVGRPGFTWAGVKSISAKREWPDWRPPDEMLARRPDLPRYMRGGPENPLGARALYLGSSLYRIHGSNEPWSIGTQVSSGCIRLRNEDIIDLYGRVKVGSRVVVL
jgi:lipoprotein-anchoring transpeptidase ErfK/SrfK